MWRFFSFLFDEGSPTICGCYFCRLRAQTREFSNTVIWLPPEHHFWRLHISIVISAALVLANVPQTLRSTNPMFHKPMFHKPMVNKRNFNKSYVEQLHFQQTICSTNPCPTNPMINKPNVQQTLWSTNPMFHKPMFNKRIFNKP